VKRLGPAPGNAWNVGADAVDMVRAAVPPRPLSVAAEPKRVTIDLTRAAVVVVDMQNDFCHPDGWLAGIGVDVTPARAPIRPLRRLLPVLRDHAVPIVWLNWGQRPDRLNLSPALRHVYDPTGTGLSVLTEASWGAAVVDELAIEPGDIQVSKHRMSGFWDTPLDSILRNLGRSTLLFAGVNLDQCVLHTLADANFAGHDTLLLEDCAATTNPEYCARATLLNIRQIFGFTLLSTDLMEALGP
jgi:nicotinamidase-related amidase